MKGLLKQQTLKQPESVQFGQGVIQVVYDDVF